MPYIYGMNFQLKMPRWKTICRYSSQAGAGPLCLTHSARKVRSQIGLLYLHCYHERQDLSFVMTKCAALCRLHFWSGFIRNITLQSLTAPFPNRLLALSLSSSSSSSSFSSSSSLPSCCLCEECLWIHNMDVYVCWSACAVLWMRECFIFHSPTCKVINILFVCVRVCRFVRAFACTDKHMGFWENVCLHIFIFKCVICIL